MFSKEEYKKGENKQMKVRLKVIFSSLNKIKRWAFRIMERAQDYGTL